MDILTYTRNGDGELVELRDKVEAGDARMSDFIETFDPPEEDRTYIQGPTKRALDAYNGSLDATLALHEAVLPGWNPSTISRQDAGYWYVELRRGFHTSYDLVRTGRADTPARAWLLAILEALIAEGE